MDTEDIFVARERLALAERRIAELTAHGVDIADLASQVSFARGALAQGRTLDVLAICEEVLLSARRVSGFEPARTAPAVSEATAPVPAIPQATSRESQGDAASRYQSGVYATPGAEALDRHRLTEEIRQVVHADLMPKALTPAQLNDRIEKMVDKAFKARAGKLEADIDQRFQRLAADPETRPFAKDEPDLPAEITAQLEARLESRAAGIAKQTAQAISDATASLEVRLAEIADPQRLRAAITSAIDHRIGEGLAQLDLQHQESAARRAVTGVDSAQRTDETLARLTTAIETLDQSLAVRIAAVVAENLPAAVAQTTADLGSRLDALGDPQRFSQLVTETVDATLAAHFAARDLEADESTAGRSPVIDPALLAQLSQTVTALENLLPERIAAAIDARLPLALSQTTTAITDAVHQQLASTVAPAVDVPVIIAGLGKELRDDLAWQVERLAAERGWISIADMQAELSRTSSGHTSNGNSNNGNAGFARLEAALVEFVHQTQSQQQQFLAVLQQKVESGTAIVAQQLLRQRVGSESFGVAGAAPGRSPDPTHHAALEALAPASTSDYSLDVLSQSAQFRAISTLGDPTRPATATFLPGTQVTRRPSDLTASTAPPAVQPPTTTRLSPALESESETTETTQATEATSLMHQAQAPDSTLDDFVTTTADVITNLHTDVLELNPLIETQLPHTARHDHEAAADALPTAVSGNGATSALARTTETRVSTPAIPGTGRVTEAVAASETESARTITHITARSSAAFPATPLTPATVSTVAAAMPGTASISGTSAAARSTPAPARDTATASATGTVRMTGRVAALDASLRLLVQREVTAQMGRSLTDNQLNPSGLQPSDAASGAPSALAPHGANHLRDELVHVLRDPAVRQHILGVVAVEALANPGALGELTGLRAFIRDEIRKATLSGPAATDAEKSLAESAP